MKASGLLPSVAQGRLDRGRAVDGLHGPLRLPCPEVAVRERQASNSLTDAIAKLPELQHRLLGALNGPLRRPEGDLDQRRRPERYSLAPLEAHLPKQPQRVLRRVEAQLGVVLAGAMGRADPRQDGKGGATADVEADLLAELDRLRGLCHGFRRRPRQRQRIRDLDASDSLGLLVAGLLGGILGRPGRRQDRGRLVLRDR
mmetsp:Transcript_82100/g.230336  ORF Transcript_82100/g.230336 Transcript_82100/m.230336 type:complete len:200 (-) Transcript_82100:98-697(-)